MSSSPSALISVSFEHNKYKRIKLYLQPVENSNHLQKYPALAKQSSIQGKVIVEFIVTKTGKVKNARIIKGIGGGCDEEAIAVISNMPNWKPGMQNGQAVDVYFTIPIFFSLN